MLKTRNFYKPFQFGWAYDLWKKHEALHWLPAEVPMHEDVRDWNNKLNDSEKNLLTHLFRFFTQADVSIAEGYNKHFLPYFSGVPELAMMMSSFAAREAIHIDAYSTLLETVGMPETTYSEFQSYKEMKDKNDYLKSFRSTLDLSLLETLGVFSAFGEGVQLFGSFVILLNFSRFNKMKAMGNIISWSVRDEDLHVEGMTRLFRECSNTLRPSQYETLLEVLYEHANNMVDMEDHFINLCFEGNGIEGLTAKEVKDYIRFLANKRWKQLGFSIDLFPLITKNPLPWVDYIINGEEHTNFFEQKVTAYSKAMTQGSMEDIEWK